MTTETPGQKVHRLVFTTPVSDLLSAHGIEHNPPTKTGWVNIAVCPICRDAGHAKPKAAKNRQCGVKETPGTKGKGTIKAVKCFHSGDASYFDFLEKLGAITASERHEYDQAKRNNTLWPKKTSNDAYVRQQRDRLAKELWSDSEPALKAREYLTGPKRQFTADTIKRFHFGLQSELSDARNVLRLPISDDKGPEYAPVLASDKKEPDAKQRGQYMNLTVPGLTENARGKTWKTGQVLTFWTSAVPDRTAVDLVVCDGVNDAILLWQTLDQAGVAERFSIISTTAGVATFPDEWKTPDFWRPWRKVYLAQDKEKSNDKTPHEDACEKIYLIAQSGKDVNPAMFRARVPAKVSGQYVKDWGDFFAAGGTAKDTLAIFETAPDMAEVIAAKTAAETAKSAALNNTRPILAPGKIIKGEFDLEELDLSYAYANGYYYYPFTVQCFDATPEGEQTLSEVTKILRSDGTVTTWYKLPSNGGKPWFALRDGTIISTPPAASPFATWKLASIKRYIADSQAGLPTSRPLGQILTDCLKLLKECIWLPYDEDYYVLVFSLLVPYLQEIFESVPYVLLNGPKGTGKSSLAKIFGRLSANSKILGAGSHAFAAAVINQIRGLMILDDKEQLAAGRDIDEAMLEILKIGYNKTSGLRGVMDKDRRMLYQRVFGVKLITNITGVEDVLGTRMLKITTGKYSPGKPGKPPQAFLPAHEARAEKLRQELHAWSFSHVEDVRAAYLHLLEAGEASDRDREIKAPLRAFAACCEDSTLVAELEKALKMQSKQASAVDASPETVLRDVVQDLIASGYSIASITHIRNELAMRLDPNEGREWTNQIPKWHRESWIARALKSSQLVRPDEDVIRQRIGGKIPQRLWRFDPSLVKEVTSQLPTPPQSHNPLDFCAGCQTCHYIHKCPIAAERQDKIAKN
jgi:hypothetical protein